MIYAAISADIVSSTSLCIEETVALKQRIENLFSILKNAFPGFWGRLIKGDYIESLVPSAKDAFRVSLLLKSNIKSFPIAKSKGKNMFQTYGVRMAMGIGDMRLIDETQGIMDGEAIYLSGRALSRMGTPNKKGTFLIEPADKQLKPALQTIGMLTDALLNNATKRQSEIIFYHNGEISVQIFDKEGNAEKAAYLAPDGKLHIQKPSARTVPAYRERHWVDYNNPDWIENRDKYSVKFIGSLNLDTASYILAELDAAVPDILKKLYGLYEPEA